MVKNNIKLKIDKKDYIPGDKVSGKLILEIEKPINARELRIGIYQMGYPTKPAPNSRDKPQMMPVVEKSLDLEKEYASYEYSFELEIPSILPDFNHSSIDEMMLKTFSFLLCSNYFIEATLDLPEGSDVSRRIEVNITSN